MRYSDLYHQSVKNFIRPGNQPSDNTAAAFDIQILIEKTFDLSRSEFWVKKNETIDDQNRLDRFNRNFRRLQNREPLAYIIREKYFFNDTFYVNRKVLIPRPETELLVAKAIACCLNPTHILEIGAGCGNIAISIAKYTDLPVFATEIQTGAFQVFKKNIMMHHQAEKVIPILADLFPPEKRQFDLIISNPPYLSRDEWDNLPVHIRDFEPRMALVGGPNGYEVIERIIAGAGKFLKTGGRIFIEIGFNQKPVVNRMFENHGFREIRFFKDFNHIFRLAAGRL